MKFYLSSYRFGNYTEKLKAMIPQNNKLGHINNAVDFTGVDVERALKRQTDEMAFLNQFGFEAEALDLRTYFGNKNALKEKLNELGAIWISGGNCFVLRQAMYLSGFDELFEMLKQRNDFLWGGYSAGICILQPSLKTIEIVDNPNDFPYEGINEPIYEGLNYFNFSFMPHYDSDHPESELVGKAIEQCINNKNLFVALRDGEVLIYD